MIKKTLKTAAFSLLAAFTFASCSNSNSQKADMTKGKTITANQIFQYAQDTAQDGQRYSIAGYFSLKEDIQLDRNKTVHLDFYTAPGGKGKYIRPFMLNFGKDANQFYAPKEFTLADLKVFDNDGKPLTYKDKMQVSFTLDLLTDRARKNMIYMTKNAKGFPEKHEVYAYPFLLKNIRIDKAQ